MSDSTDRENRFAEILAEMLEGEEQGLRPTIGSHAIPNSLNNFVLTWLTVVNLSKSLGHVQQRPMLLLPP